MKPPVKFYWKGPHHGYLGIACLIVGEVMVFLNWGNGLSLVSVAYELLALFGIYLMIDDLIEHTITEDTPARIIWNRMIGKK